MDPKDITLLDLQALFPDEEKAREWLEQVRWPNGPICPHCKASQHATVGVRILKIKPNPEKKIRAGLYLCMGCKKQFTVTVGSVMEASKLPLRKWIMGFYLMMSSKTGISALALQRHLGLGSYRTAWFMAHRIRECLKQSTHRLFGIVEADETYYGGPPRHKFGGEVVSKPKVPVVGLVQRDGELRVQIMPKVDSGSIRRMIEANVEPRKTTLHTDESRLYTTLGRRLMKGHETVNHSIHEYARGDVTTNTIEGFFGLLKTGIVGVYHGVGPKYLDRYADEYVWRYNRRKMTDGQRFLSAIRHAPGHRLTLEQPKRRANG